MGLMLPALLHLVLVPVHAPLWHDIGAAVFECLNVQMTCCLGAAHTHAGPEDEMVCSVAVDCAMHSEAHGCTGHPATVFRHTVRARTSIA